MDLLHAVQNPTELQPRHSQRQKDLSVQAFEIRRELDGPQLVDDDTGVDEVDDEEDAVPDTGIQGTQDDIAPQGEEETTHGKRDP